MVCAVEGDGGSNDDATRAASLLGTRYGRVLMQYSALAPVPLSLSLSTLKLVWAPEQSNSLFVGCQGCLCSRLDKEFFKLHVSGLVHVWMSRQQLCQRGGCTL